MKGFEGGLQAEQKSRRKPRRIVRFVLSKQPQNMAPKGRVIYMNNPPTTKLTPLQRGIKTILNVLQRRVTKKGCYLG